MIEQLVESGLCSSLPERWAYRLQLIKPHHQREALTFLTVFVGTWLLGGLGFMLTEQVSFGQEAFIAFNCMTTLGMTDPPQSPAGQWLVVVTTLFGILSIFGIGTCTLLYLLPGTVSHEEKIEDVTEAGGETVATIAGVAEPDTMLRGLPTDAARRRETAALSSSERLRGLEVYRPDNQKLGTIDQVLTEITTRRQGGSTMLCCWRRHRPRV
jgi:hypothetical protein